MILVTLFIIQQLKDILNLDPFIEENGWRNENLEYVLELERKLSSANSHSSILQGFKTYLYLCFQVQEGLNNYYSNFLFQINCWHSWRETQSSEDQFIQSIGTVFGKDVILAYL
jgi:hypothetical protein